jgi:hypothetical protein
MTNASAEKTTSISCHSCCPVHLLAGFHVNVLLKGIEIEQSQDLISSIVGPIRSKDLFFDWTSVPVEVEIEVKLK